MAHKSIVDLCGMFGECVDDLPFTDFSKNIYILNDNKAVNGSLLGRLSTITIRDELFRRMYHLLIC